MDLPNTGENLALQVAAARVGASVATVKDVEGAGKLGAKVSASGGRLAAAIAAESTSLLSRLGPVGAARFAALDGGDLLATLGVGPGDAPDEAPEDAEASCPHAYWGSTSGLDHGTILSLGDAAARELGLTAEDRVCVAITLCHAFGIGSACAAAFQQGAAVVLPAVGGIRGCGVPSQRAEVTLRVLASERCTTLFADTHTLKAFAEPALAEAREGLDLSALRTGVCKVGSGSDFLPEDVEFDGVRLRTMGKKK
mmetsp:Transcript_23305/g.78324  ORF Transcript_23305/g.78324 Transcript_23305/m.78324 type:complete len:254 (+) Transcript_23305:93-854(+)